MLNLNHLKLNSSHLLSILLFLVGCFLGNKFGNSGEKQSLSQEQNQQQAQNHGLNAQNGCVAETGKKTNPDGSIEDFFRFRAAAQANLNSNQSQSSDQKQKIEPQEPSIDIFAGGGASSKGQGWGAAEAITGRHSFEYLTNGPEYIGIYKIKVFSF